MHDELKRLQAVYSEYDNDDAIQDRRDSANKGNRKIFEERAREIYTLLHTYELIPLGQRKVLDIGCGRGDVLASLLDFGAKPQNLHGIDLLPGRIKAASRAYPDINFIRGNAECLEFPDIHFDLVLLFTVFSSILDDHMAHNVSREVFRVLKLDGAILWYDFRYNIPWNPHTHRMTKQKIQHYFYCFDINLHPITLLPPVARLLGRLTPALYPLLARIPPMRTHYLGLFTKKFGSHI